MPLLLSSLISGLALLFRSQVGSWVVAAMAWLGIAWATQSFAVGPWLDNLRNNMQGGSPGGEWGALIIQYAGLMKFDQACTMLASAVTTKFALNSARAFLVKKT